MVSKCNFISVGFMQSDGTMEAESRFVLQPMPCDSGRAVPATRAGQLILKW